jgi:DNA-binding CsgD family transcriptional regulator
VVDRSGAVVVPLTFLALVLLPDGHLPSTRWRPLTATVVAMQIGVVAVWSLVSGVAPEASSKGGPNPLGALPASWAGTVDSLGDWVLQVPFLLVVAAIFVRLRRPGERARLAGVLGGAAGFAALAVAGRLMWPGAADALDVLGATVFGIGLTSTLLRQPEPVPDGDGEPAAELVDTSALRQLSGREQEVLELVAEGMTNRQIAERLVISPVTARNHVSSILTKLGLENRTQAATWLARARPDR